MNASGHSSAVERPAWDRKAVGSNPAAPTTKACRKCGVVKPLSEFYFGGYGTDQHIHRCKACCRAYENERNRAAQDARRKALEGATKLSADQLRDLPDEKLVRMVNRKVVLRRWIDMRITAINRSGVKNPTLFGQVAAFRRVLRWLDTK